RRGQVPPGAIGSGRGRNATSRPRWHLPEAAYRRRRAARQASAQAASSPRASRGRGEPFVRRAGCRACGDFTDPAPARKGSDDGWPRRHAVPAPDAARAATGWSRHPLPRECDERRAARKRNDSAAEHVAGKKPEIGRPLGPILQRQNEVTDVAEGRIRLRQVLPAPDRIHDRDLPERQLRLYSPERVIGAVREDELTCRREDDDRFLDRVDNGLAKLDLRPEAARERDLGGDVR